MKDVSRAQKVAFDCAVREAAEVIADDLGIRPGQTDLASVLDLTSKYGGDVMEFDLPAGSEGYYRGGWILVNKRLPSSSKATVILHELIHRLVHSDAYEPLNSVGFRGWDALMFQESICVAVERIFVEAGGANVRGFALN